MNSGHRTSSSGSIAHTPSCSEDMVSHVGMKRTHVLVVSPYGDTLARNLSVGNHSSPKGRYPFNPGLRHQKRAVACDACLPDYGPPLHEQPRRTNRPKRRNVNLTTQNASDR